MGNQNTWDTFNNIFAVAVTPEEYLLAAFKPLNPQRYDSYP